MEWQTLGRTEKSVPPLHSSFPQLLRSVKLHSVYWLGKDQTLKVEFWTWPRIVKTASGRSGEGMRPVGLSPKTPAIANRVLIDSRCRWQMWPLTVRKSSEIQKELHTWKCPKVRTLHMSPRWKFLNKISPKLFPWKGSLSVMFSKIFSHLSKAAEDRDMIG